MEEDIRTLNVKESFLLLTQYMTEIEDFEGLQEVYDTARFGIKLKFDLYDYIYENITMKGKTGKIIYRGRTIDLSNFWTELEARNILIKKWLIENTEEEGVIKSYETKD